MRKYFYLFFYLLVAFNNLYATTGDTTYVKVFNTVSWNHYGNFDQWGVFPISTKKFQRIMMKYTVACESNGQCEWDYTNTIYVRQNTHIKDSTLKKATTFTVNGAVKDSFNYSIDTTWITSYNATTKKTDSVPSTKATIIHFAFISQLQPQVPIDTIKVYPVQYYKYYYDTNGVKTDSAFVQVKNTVRAVYTNYYSVFDKIIDFEMGRMITPYAKLNTLPRPFSYEYIYDVTDYASLLHDSVQIRFNYSGYSWGFTGTIEFFMIEGMPAREAYKVENIWNGYFYYGKSSDSIEKRLTPYYYTKDTASSSVKLRMTVTGHGSDANGCCEFMPNNYLLKLNNAQFAQNQIWKGNCGSNPIINQGGTWIYDRANWCPGMKVFPYEYNLNSVSGANTISIKMDNYVSAGSYGGYTFGAQLIYYKKYSFINDAGIETILAPTQEFVFNRTNPVCDNAQIIIRNFGTQNITSAIIKYQIGDGVPQIYNWTGLLKFDEKDTVTLPDLIWANPSGVKTFTVWIDKVNGVTDEYVYNNSKSSTFDFPLVLPLQFVIESKTNLNPSENSYQIKTASGQLIFSKKFTLANTMYRDTFNLVNGCYTFNFIDSGGDGLSFWNNTSQGSGSVRFVKTPINQTLPILKSFNPDFGNFLTFNFRAGSPVGIDEIHDFSKSISIYPQPAQNKVIIKSEQEYISKVEIISLEGRLIKSYNETEIPNGEVDITSINNGIYIMHISGINGEQTMKKLLVVK